MTRALPDGSRAGGSSTQRCPRWCHSPVSFRCLLPARLPGVCLHEAADLASTVPITSTRTAATTEGGREHTPSRAAARWHPDLSHRLWLVRAGCCRPTEARRSRCFFTRRHTTRRAAAPTSTHADDTTTGEGSSDADACRMARGGPPSIARFQRPTRGRLRISCSTRFQASRLHLLAAPSATVPPSRPARQYPTYKSHGSLLSVGEPTGWSAPFRSRGRRIDSAVQAAVCIRVIMVEV
jgi:hypothetical protein